MKFSLLLPPEGANDTYGEHRASRHGVPQGHVVPPEPTMPPPPAPVIPPGAPPIGDPVTIPSPPPPATPATTVGWS
jgi:hypothetical protein